MDCLAIVEVEWNTTRGRKRNCGCVHDCRFMIGEPWPGNMTMALIPVDAVWVFEELQPVIKIQFYAPPKDLDIFDFIHAGVDCCDRLYFSPKQYPTPQDLKTADTSDAFHKLREYIEQSAKHWGSPVVCRAGRSESKIFQCKHSKDCKFSFTLKWDKFGFYIPVSVGQPVHTGHDRVEPCPHIKFGCACCSETFHCQKDAIHHEDNFLCSQYYKKVKSK